MKERHFPTPLALHAKRPQPWHDDRPAKQTKGKGKGEGKEGPRTPDRKPICFRYNAKNGCKNGSKLPLRTCVLAMLPESLCYQMPQQEEGGRAR